MAAGRLAAARSSPVARRRSPRARGRPAPPGRGPRRAVHHRAEQLARGRPPARPRRRRPGSGRARARTPGPGGPSAARTPAPRRGRRRRRAAAACAGQLRRAGSAAALAERLGQHVAGQPPLGVAHRALAHQLERHDRGGLLEDQPLEVAQPAGVARGHQPGLGRPAAAAGHRQRQRAPGQVGVVGHELRRRRPRVRPRLRARAPARPRRARRPPGSGAAEGALARSAPRGRRAPSRPRRSPPRARAPARRARAPRSPAAPGACGWRCPAGARRTARSRAA